MLRQILKYSLSLYSGIPPSLLASISMSESLKATSQSELIRQLIKRNIIQKGQVEKVGMQIDRAWFTSHKTPYYDIPTPISKHEFMTNPLTQLLSLKYIYQNISILTQPKLKILDVGCGHGYMTFALTRLLQTKGICKTLGIDIWEQCIQQAKKIKQQKFNSSDIQFKKENIQKFQCQKFDVIYCGFYVDNNLHNSLIAAMNENSLGVWPISEDGQQKLYIFKKINNILSKEYILTTLFSKQRQYVSQGIQKYFLQFDNEGVQDQSDNRVEVKTVQQKIKKDCQKQKDRLKEWQQQFKRNHNRVPTLIQMKSDSEINGLLEIIRKANR